MWAKHEHVLHLLWYKSLKNLFKDCGAEIILFVSSWVISILTGNPFLIPDGAGAKCEPVGVFSVHVSVQTFCATRPHSRRLSRTSPPPRCRSRNACRWSRFSSECRTWVWTSPPGWGRGRSEKEAGTPSERSLGSITRWKMTVVQCWQS